MALLQLLLASEGGKCIAKSMCIHCCEQLGFGVLDKIDHLASINIQQLLKLGDGVNELQLESSNR